MKNILFVIFFFSAINTFAQNNDYVFQRDFMKVFKYPEFYRNSCNPTFANLLIEVSEKGTISDILISDSAPVFFKEEFNKIKSSINKAPLDSIIAEKKLKGCDIIIPVFYVYQSDWCVNSFNEFLPDRYLLFNGKEIDILTYNLKPIFLNMYKPVR